MNVHQEEEQRAFRWHNAAKEQILVLGTASNPQPVPGLHADLHQTL